jgi:hypothetical protein
MKTIHKETILILFIPKETNLLEDYKDILPMPITPIRHMISKKDIDWQIMIEDAEIKMIKALFLRFYNVISLVISNFMVIL